MVADAQRSRAPIQRLADVVAGYFVPAVLICAVAGVHRLVLSGARAGARACDRRRGRGADYRLPVRAGTGDADVDHGRRPARGASAGVLVRDAQALELHRKIDTLVVDKTGTLTVGKPALTAVVALAPFDEAGILRLAAWVERLSEHPLGTAIVTGAAARQLKLSDAIDFHRSRAWA